MSRLGLEMLTVLGMPPVDHIRLAAKLGCTLISTGLSGLPMRQLGVPDWTLFADWSLETDGALRAEMKSALRDTGVRIALGEGFRVRSDGDVRDRGASLDIMADLGAERINAVSMETDLARTHDQLAQLCDMVTARGMQFTIEFAPPNAIHSLAAALAAIDHIGRGKCRLLLDAMHFFRSGATVAELAALDPDLIGYVQLCDAPLESPGGTYMQEAMFSRMVPGEGQLPLRDFVAALPPTMDIGLEVPILAETLAAGGPDAVAARAIGAAAAILASIR
jgi:sugar phosphate isomerase/epimerase